MVLILSRVRGSRVEGRTPSMRHGLCLAESPAADVEVEVVVVEFVALGGKHDVEIIASALGDGTQKIALGSWRVPVVLDGHALAVSQQKSRDIDGAAGGVL